MNFIDSGYNIKAKIEDFLVRKHLLKLRSSIYLWINWFRQGTANRRSQ